MLLISHLITYSVSVLAAPVRSLRQIMPANSHEAFFELGFGRNIGPAFFRL